MDVSAYITVSRQSGLLREMGQIANNLANMSSNGFRREGTVFSEFIRDAGSEVSSVSMSNAGISVYSKRQGVLEATGGALDLAIEGPGFFLIQSGEDERLTRAGQFTQSPTGELATSDGDLLLDAGGATIFVPPDATSIKIAADGTLSTENGPLTQIGVWQPSGGTRLDRAEGVSFAFDGPLEISGQANLVQGHLEGSNVDPVIEVARMIAVQRSYELGQSFLEREDERVRNFIRSFDR